MTLAGLLLLLFFLVYLFYTLRFAIHFNKTDRLYTKRQKKLHNILIWLVPFLWISILKVISKPPQKPLKDNNASYNDWYDGVS